MSNRSISQLTEVGYSPGLLIPVADMSQPPGSKNGAIAAAVLLAAAGTSGNSAIFSATAAATISAHVAVAAASGGVIPADASNAAIAGGVLGIAVSAANAGGTIDIQSSGPLDFSGWAWTPGKPVYVGANGVLTQAPPSTGFLQSVGVAETATTLLVSLGDAYVL